MTLFVSQQAQKRGHPINNPWTKSEDDLLTKEFRNADSTAVLAARLGRTVEGTRARAKVLGLHPRLRWTPAQDARLRIEYGTTPTDELARSMNRRVEPLHMRAMKLGITRTRLKARTWETIPEAARRLGITNSSMLRSLVKIGLVAEGARGAGMPRRLYPGDADRAVAAFPTRGPSSPHCLICGPGKKVEFNGLCCAHLARKRLNGDPLLVHRRDADGSWRLVREASVCGAKDGGSG